MSPRVVSRYVKSLLVLATDYKVLDVVHADLNLLTDVVSENRNLALMLRNPVVKPDKKKQILRTLFKSRVNKLTMSFLDIICTKGREDILPEIAREFHNEYNAQMGIGKASVVSAVKLDGPLKKEIEAIAKKLCGQPKVELSESVDPELIGGFVLRVGDQQIDASIRDKLKALQLDLQDNQFVRKM